MTRARKIEKLRQRMRTYRLKLERADYLGLRLAHEEAEEELQWCREQLHLLAALNPGRP